MFLSWDEISQFTDVDMSVFWQYSWFLLCSKTNQTNDNNNSFFSLSRKVHIFKKGEYKEGKFHRQMPNKFQGKSLTLTENSPSVFVTVTVSNIVRF